LYPMSPDRRQLQRVQQRLTAMNKRSYTAVRS
jgi:hypothetical protein